MGKILERTDQVTDEARSLRPWEMGPEKVWDKEATY